MKLLSKEVKIMRGKYKNTNDKMSFLPKRIRREFREKDSELPLRMIFSGIYYSNSGSFSQLKEAIPWNKKVL